MNRSKWFLMVNKLIFGIILILFFYYGRTAADHPQTGSGNLTNKKDFVKESVLLDSLFNNYKTAAAGNDEAALIDSELRLKDQINKMRDNCDQKSFSNKIACKLIHNYELRIKLIVASGMAETERSDKTHLLKTHIAELEKANEQIRLQNQMVEQAILNLP